MRHPSSIPQEKELQRDGPRGAYRCSYISVVETRRHLRKIDCALTHIAFQMATASIAMMPNAVSK